MIFAPFTGKDGHGKLVTFGAALLSNEDVESYTWVFEKFKKCMGNTPIMIITDQDPAMKIAIERIFMGVNDNFKDKLCDAVWSGLIEPSEFEEKFNALLVEFDLTNHKWLKIMFDLRTHWIPTYFRDVRMSGLFRTISMSESENNLFGTYMRQGSNLIEFFMRFESTIDSQREAHEKLNADDESCTLNMQTQLPIEKHAAEVYNFHAFLMVQTEISATCFKCQFVSRTEVDDHINYKIKNRGEECEFQIVYTKTDETFVCSCKNFVCFGILCRHIFVVLKNFGIDKILAKYIVSRWTKVALMRPMHEVGGDYLRQCNATDSNKRRINNIISTFYSCLALVDGDDDKLNAFQRRLDDIRDGFHKSDATLTAPAAKRKLISDFLNCDEPSTVSVLPPA